MPTEPFASIDDAIGQVKADHALALRTLQDRLTAAEIETVMAKKALDTAIAARIEAEKRTAKLQALFAVLKGVLAEAELLDSPPATTQSTAKQLIDQQTGGTPNAVSS